jgi:hypothetical protein
MDRHIPEMLAIYPAASEIGGLAVSGYRQTGEWGECEFR